MGRDGYAGLAILALGAVLFGATLGLERNPLIPVGPAFYPQLMLGATMLMAAALVVADVVAHRRGTAVTPAPSGANYALVVLQFAIFTAYAVALPFIGFRIATFAFLVAMQATLQMRSGRIRWALVVVIAIAATAIVYGVFDHYLHVLLPRGRWIEI